MKFKFTYLVLILATGFFLSGCMRKSSRLPSLVETYSKTDKKPFGADIAYRQIEQMYNGNIIRDKQKGFKNTWQNISDTGALYICLAPKLYVNSEEAEAMMDYVDAGNSLFIAAGYIDNVLLQKTGCDALYTDLSIEKMTRFMKDTKVRSALHPDFNFSYYYYPFQNHFIDIDSSDTRVLGFNDVGKPNFIVQFRGKGKLYLHCDPRAFSNYFLLKDNNFEYLKNVLAFTQAEPQHVYWDDYYHKQRNRRNEDNDFSTFSEIMKHPPLAWAFWLSLILLLLYILFGGKRLQRIIEKRKPNENTTVTFTETIGRLYLQKKDNKNIADKMIMYFNEYIRNTYFLNSNHVNDDFVAVLSRKSGVEKEKVDTLYRSITATQGTAVVSDYQLLSLHEQIQQFYKNRN